MGKKKELVKNTAIITIGKLCTQFMSFLLLPLYTAVLSTSEYGTVDLIATYQQLIGSVVFCQIEQALFRHLIEIREKKHDVSRVISSCIAFAAFQSTVMVILTTILKVTVGYEYAFTLCVYVIAVILAGLMLQTARGVGNNFVYALGSFIAAITIILFNILFLVVFHWGTRGMLLSYVLGNLTCAIAIFFILKIWRYLSFPAVSITQVKTCLKYSLPLVPNSLSWWVMSVSDRTIVANMLGTSFNGLLTVANKFPSAYTTFYTVFNLSWTESASLHINDPDAEDFFWNVINRVYRLFIAIAICIIAIMPFVFPIMINERYGDAYYQIPIYMAASICQMFQGIYSVIYVALKKTKEVAKSTVVSAAINLIIDLVLIKVIGLYAASISTFVAYFFLCVWRYFDLKKYLNVAFERSLLVSSVLMLGVVSVAYYYRNTWLSAVALTIAVGYSIYVNKEIVLLLIHSPRNLKEHFMSKK